MRGWKKKGKESAGSSATTVHSSKARKDSQRHFTFLDLHHANHEH